MKERCGPTTGLKKHARSAKRAELSFLCRNPAAQAVISAWIIHAARKQKTPAALREMAARARRLAGEMLDQDAKAKLIAFAEEMEARAAALEPSVSVQTISHSDAVAVQRSDPDAGKGSRS